MRRRSSRGSGSTPGVGAEAVGSAERAVAMSIPDDHETLAVLARAYAAAGDQEWAHLALWASNYHRERALHASALGGIQLPVGNVPPPPGFFRPTFGCFQRQLEAVAAAL